MASEIDTLSPKMCENALFFMSRVGSGKNIKIIESIVKKVESDHMIESGEFRDHVMLMTICNLHKIEVPLLWAQIEK